MFPVAHDSRLANQCFVAVGVIRVVVRISPIVIRGSATG